MKKVEKKPVETCKIGAASLFRGARRHAVAWSRKLDYPWEPLSEALGAQFHNSLLRRLQKNIVFYGTGETRIAKVGLRLFVGPT